MSAFIFIMDLYGVIGWPIEHSLSPAMQNAAFEALGIDAKYERIPVRPEDLEDFLLNDTKYKGFNITIPHKVRAREILENRFPYNRSDAFSRLVILSGAVNTVKRVGDKIEYLNTDVSGFSYSIEKDLGFKTSEHKGTNVLILGCGGAARAVMVDLHASSVRRIYAYDIDKNAVESAKRQFSKLSVISQEEIKDKIKECDLLVNATPIGMKEGDPLPIDKKLLRKDLYVYDVVYNRETQLVKDARSLGAKAVTGEGMLVAQGAYSFFIWTEVPAIKVIDVMRKALSSALKDKR
ncbi:MAG: shikimate dehydrogenase [Candidatus Omnitrophica bacterium]|nr:shikimate dehydrogenase [Candidatus Omnitrophota bacterium]